MNKVNLFTNYYVDANPFRQHEIDFCFKQNVKGQFHRVYVFVSSEHKIAFNKIVVPEDKNGCVVLYDTPKRPSFNDYFRLMGEQENNDSINIMVNSDMFITDTNQFVDYFRKTNFNRKICLALTRYEWTPHGSTLKMANDSQDTWAFCGSPLFKTETEYTMGIAGCDNKLAYELNSKGYRLINPCKLIKTYHFHKTNVRNYISSDGSVKRVPPPYLTIPQS